jgi:hypothetical protein
MPGDDQPAHIPGDRAAATGSGGMEAVPGQPGLPDANTGTSTDTSADTNTSAGRRRSGI